MTVRENVHQIVDALPDERLEEVLDYLAELSEPDEPLSVDTCAAIKEGIENIRRGRTITLDEYRRTATFSSDEGRYAGAVGPRKQRRCSPAWTFQRSWARGIAPPSP